MGSDAAREWMRTKAVLADVLDLPERERSVALERACGRDGQLLERLRSLLAACSAEKDEIGRLGAALDRSLALIEAPERRLGVEVDGYRLLDVIGRGGTGVVYRAGSVHGGEAVAIKLLRGGPEATTLRKRFELEGDRLGRLSHPYIVSLLDSGVTPEGEPYYVMDYVDGEAIDRYADRARLSISERLGLIVEVSEAVGHAHQNDIVHRDLKPSNILVRSSGEPALLDFGIAKLLHPIRGGRPATLTLEALAFTPRYASPEQVAGEPVSRATDVYSLGAVSYALLAGAPPPMVGRRDRRTLSRVFQTLGERQVQVAKARGSTVEQLEQALSGELEDILGRACHPVQGARYQTVEAFADELERDLRARLEGDVQ